MKKRSKQTKRHWEINRVPLTNKLQQTAVSQLRDTIKKSSEKERRSIQEVHRHLFNAGAPIRKLLESNQKALSAVKSLQKTALKDHHRRIKAFKHANVPQISTRDFTFPSTPGFSIIVPPYDVAWQTGAGFSDKTGSFEVIIGNDFSAAAVGVSISSPVRTLVRFAPEAPFSYAWSDVSFGAPTTTTGGVGIVAFLPNNPRPVLEERCTLWNDTRGWVAGDYNNGSGASFVAAALPGDFLLLMEADVQYLVWTWCFGSAVMVTQGQYLSLTLSEIQGQIPFIALDPGPVPYVR
jgi:hypothetical protein